MVDLVIRGGHVVAPWGVGSWDVAVQGEKIVAVAEPDSMPGEVGRVIDATGKIVVPGGIEPHAHVAFPLPRTSVETAPPEQVSRAALFGGTTTLTDFAIQFGDVDIFGGIAEKDARWKGKGYCDYAYHCMLLGDVPTRSIEQMPEAIQQGYPTFKIFTTNVGYAAQRSGAERRMVGAGYLSAMMDQVARHGGLMFVHAEDDDVVQYMYEKLQKEERTEWYNIHEIHNNMSEDLSFRRTIKVAEWTGAAVHFVHVSAKEGVNAIREARSRNLPIYGETLHNYASFTSEDYKQPDGMKYHTYPSLKSEEDRLALWDGLIKGGINCMATDEVCVDLAKKLEGRTIFDVAGGTTAPRRGWASLTARGCPSSVCPCNGSWT